MNTFSFIRNQTIGITLTFLSVTMNSFSEIIMEIENFKKGL